MGRKGGVRMVYCSILCQLACLALPFTVSASRLYVHGVQSDRFITQLDRDAAERNLQSWLKHVRNTSDNEHTHIGTAHTRHTRLSQTHENNPLNSNIDAVEVDLERQDPIALSSATTSGKHKHQAGCNNKKRVIHVEQDGSGHFRSIQVAINSLPKRNKCRVNIQIGPGIFREKVHIPKLKAHVTLKGKSHKRTIIVWNATAADFDRHGRRLGTLHSATVEVDSDHFIAKNLTFMNAAPSQQPGVVGQQAVALRISGDKAAFFHCRFIAHQDTLYDHTGRHYFKNCYVEGTVDFIFGNGRSFYEEADLYADADHGIPGAITAQKRNDTTSDTGFSFVRSRITGAGMVYLGRAWGNDSRVVFASTYMAKVIVQEGWEDWGIPAREKTVYYAQFNCSGPGADLRHRVKWARKLTAAEAAPFLSVDFVNGYSWIEGFETSKHHH